jgi:predicted nucleic acid-binding protein
MVICADTSALFSLYANDFHTPRTVQWLTAQQNPLLVTPLNEFELFNALRFAEFRGAIASGEAVMFWGQFEEDRNAGRVVRQPCNLATVLDEAMRLSAAYTLSGGHRGFAILHTAAAIILDAEQFLTFDEDQKRLATAEGLVVPI